MLQSVNLAREEEIEKSKELVSKLDNSKLTPKERNELLAELEAVTGGVRRTIIQEILIDLNSLGPLLRGTLVRALRENYEAEVENKAPMERYGWVAEVINGQKMMYDPAKDEENREYKPIPMMKVEKTRTVYLCETNREQIGKIADLLKAFLEKCKGEFRYTSIDTILDEKRSTEYQIASIDRGKMRKENFSEFEYQDSEYIKKPMPQNISRPLDVGFKM